MAAKDLITRARAYQDLQGVTPTAAIDSLLDALITACSDAIAKFCRRDFVSRVYDELVNGTGDRRLPLRQYPVQSVQSVRYRPATVLKVQNTNTALNQRATVAVTSTGLTLTRVASGVTTTNTLTFAGNATLQALANAITALGNGWTGQVVGDAAGDYGLWPSADLYVPPSFGDGTQSQGALTARGQFAELKLHTYELAGYQWDPRGWLLRAIPYTDPELLHPEDLTWPAGVNNFRITYTAGYTTVPESVQEACAAWVSTLYYVTTRDPLLSNQLTTAGAASGWGNLLGSKAAPPPRAAAMLAPYRRHTVASGRG